MISSDLGDDILVASQMRVTLGTAEDAGAVDKLLKDPSHHF